MRAAFKRLVDSAPDVGNGDPRRPPSPNLDRPPPARSLTEAKGLCLGWATSTRCRDVVSGGHAMRPARTTMTKDKQRKARVRARMTRTGESYAAAHAQITKTSGRTVALPTERRHMGSLVAHGCKYGDYPWDHWFARARAAGVGESLAHLGRSLMREADQHAWCAELRERCGWTEESAAGMIRFALDEPKVAERHWSRLMDTDGCYGVFERSDFREFTDEEFVREYTAFALAFDAYFPTDRLAAEDPDPWVEVPGAPGIRAPRSQVTRMGEMETAKDRKPS